MGVGVDAAFDAFFLGVPPPAPVHVETPGTGVEFDDGAGFCGGVDDGGDVDVVGGALEQQAASEVAEHGDVWVFDGADDALGHFGLG